jgi:hypothetical protein
MMFSYLGQIQRRYYQRSIGFVSQDLLVKRLELISRVLCDFRKRRIASQVERLADIVLNIGRLACGGRQSYSGHQSNPPE